MIDMTKQNIDTLAHSILHKIENIIEDSEEDVTKEHSKIPTVEFHILHRVTSLLNLYGEFNLLQRPDGCSDPFDNTRAVTLVKFRAQVYELIAGLQEDFNIS